MGIRLGLPPGWVKFDPKDREDLGSTLNAIESVLAPLGEAGLLPACVRLPEIAEQVSETSRVMVGGNVLLAAGWASPVHVDGKLTMVTASMTVAVESVTALGRASSHEIHDALEHVAAVALHGKDALTSTQTTVDLPPGKGVRLAWNDHRVAPWGGKARPCRVVQFMVPVATTDAVIFLTCETPTVLHAEQLEPVFDAIASTLDPLIT